MHNKHQTTGEKGATLHLPSALLSVYLSLFPPRPWLISFILLAVGAAAIGMVAFLMRDVEYT